MDKFNRMLAANEPFALSIFRFMIGLAMFQFGAAKLLKFPVVAPFDKVPAFSLFWDAGVIELVFGGLLMLGLFTRCVAFVLCGEMAFAYFISHFPKGFIPLLNAGNLAIMFCFACLLLTTAGGGPWSLDALLRKKG
jgi:putative oxidoreductase